MLYERIIAEALGTPWCVTPRMAGVVLDVLRFRSTGGRWTFDEIASRIEAEQHPQRQPPIKSTERSIAVVPIHGLIAHRTFEASSGMTSTDEISLMLSRAVRDSSVDAIVLDIASNGGTSTGVPELAVEIATAAGIKPVIAIANGMAHSAALWLASQATEFVVIPSGFVGSIGVFTIHEDFSKALEQEGIALTSIQFGQHKLDTAPWVSLTDDAKARLQQEVDRIGRAFVSAVASGRRVTPKEVQDNFGQGDIFGAVEAKKIGLVDRVETPAETLARIVSKSSRIGRKRAAAADRDALDISIAMRREKG